MFSYYFNIPQIRKHHIILPCTLDNVTVPLLHNHTSDYSFLYILYIVNLQDSWLLNFTAKATQADILIYYTHNNLVHLVYCLLNARVSQEHDKFQNEEFAASLQQ